jgi:mono/diheme cytochrome c family protein
MPLDARPNPRYRDTRTAGPSNSRAAVVGAIGLASLAVACRIEPDTPVLHFSLAESTTDPEAEVVIPGEVQDHILGSLRMLFGTPSNPQYLLLGDWIDDAYDPNFPSWPADDYGGGEFTDEQLEELWAGNEWAFRKQLALIAEERYDEVAVPATAPDLVTRWGELRAEREDFEDAAEFKVVADETFRYWYPTLRDSAEMYRLQCVHCHGAEGGGDGPTADFLSPRPRDYRMGVFKFTAMKDKAMPSRGDLFKILEHGVTGTAMPSFRRFSDTELHGLVDYVRLLSIRGMVERDLATTYRFDGALPAEYVLESYEDTWSRWGEHTDKVVYYGGEVPHPTEASIARGKELFNDAATGNCFSCHGEYGRGDGYAVYVTDPETGKLVLDKKDDWGDNILPRNIPQGIFRGGRRPIDIYRRVYAGINGTPMPALGESKKADGSPLVSTDELWSIVHYVGYLSEQGPRPGVHRTADAGHGHSGAAHDDEAGHEHGAEGEADHSHDAGEEH